MKKKIIFGLSTLALMFFLGGFYIVMTMEKTIFELHSLSQLHNPVALRKDLLASVERNQEKIKLRGTRYALPAESLRERTMIDAVNICFSCHKSGPSLQAIKRLKSKIQEYSDLSRRVLSAPSAYALPKPREDYVLQMGDDLVKNISGIIALTSRNLAQKENDILKIIKNRRLLLLMLVTIGPFFALGFAFVLLNGITGPVKSLLDATRRLKGGDLDYRIRGLAGEFGEVAESFNEMAGSLKNQMQVMQRTEQLRVSGEMAAGLAHEIRNPLAGIKLSIEVLMAELNLEDRDKVVLEKIIEQIRQMELLVRNLLNFARPVASQPMTINVNSIVQRTISFMMQHPLFLSAIPRKKIIQEFDPALPNTVGDPQQLQQVFSNLFLNAADAMPEGGLITVKTGYDKAEKTIVIEFHDTGEGIPEDIREKIFQPFFTTKRKGTGLGLAVSKRLIEENGGSITSFNNAVGGATFRIVLPLITEEKGAEG